MLDLFWFQLDSSGFYGLAFVAEVHNRSPSALVVVRVGFGFVIGG